MCVCRKGWHGADCSVPEALWSTKNFQVWYSQGLITRRSRPRSIFSGVVINHEIDLFEIRVREVGDAVDYYIVCESNFTFFGEAKPAHFQSKLTAGFLRDNASKIIPVVVGDRNFDHNDPWAPENYLRTTLWLEGERRLKNVRDDDLVMLADADEVPSRDVLLFLKHHDGYGEPIALRMRSFLYGFFWEMDKKTEVGAVCTVAFLRKLYKNDLARLRRMDTYSPRMLPHTGTFQLPWVIEGTWPHYAGWHCSWCFDARGIQVKLTAAQKDDGVRWGDYAEKTDLAYIDSLRKTGRYFDGSSPLKNCNAYEAAPPYVRANLDRFRYLMIP
ncbi:hypothetical protein V5799_028470 [Amblyomma americanum]|uniref:EGF-like domain-containing protein n=1 Tax=Amblyomma americanum TaxID=6943 RepID=A0AAQ4DCR9_AMBAM